MGYEKGGMGLVWVGKSVVGLVGWRDREQRRINYFSVILSLQLIVSTLPVSQ